MSGYGRSRYRRLGLLFCAIGLAVFLVSTALAVPALIASGFGAFLIGLLLAYLSFVPSVPSELLGETLRPAMNNLEALLRRFKVNAYATYIHPNSKAASFRVFIPLSEHAAAKPPSLKNTNEIVIVPSDSGVNGLLLEPPGAGLLALIERESGQEIASVELTGLQEVLSVGIIRSLELASSIKLTFEGPEVHLLVEGDALWKFTKELAEKAPIMCERIGCPICSLVACALTKSSRRDVRFRGAKHFDGRHRASFELLE
jgi:hypothetical protein